MGVIRRLGYPALLASLIGCAGHPDTPSPPPAGSTRPAPSSTPPLAGSTPPRALSPCELAAAQRARIPALLAEGRLDRTVRVFRHADTLCPASAGESLAGRVRALAELGRIEEARQVADAIEASADASSEARGAALAARAEIAKQVNRLVPVSAVTAAEASLQAAIQMLDAGRLVEAKRGFLEAWSLDHSSGEALYHAGHVAKESGESAEAQRLFDRAMVALERQTGTRMGLWVAPPISFSSTRWTWSGDGRFLAVAQDQTLSIRDRQRSFRETVRLPLVGDVGAVVFSPDHTTFAYSTDGECAVHVWNAATGQSLHSLDHPCAPEKKEYSCPPNVGSRSCPHRTLEHVDSIAFAPDGTTLASASSGGDSGSIRVWTMATGGLLYQVAGENIGGPLLFSGDGKTLLGIARGERVFNLDAWVVEPAPTPNGRRSMGVRLWQAATGRLTRTLVPGKEVQQLAVSPDGKTFAALYALEHHAGVKVDVWDLPSGKHVRELALDQGDSLSFSADGKELISSRTAWDVATWTPHPIEPPPAVSPDGKLIVRKRQKGTEDLEIVDAATRSLVRTLTRLPASEATTVAASSRDGTAFVTGEARSWLFTPSLECHQVVRQATSVAASPEGVLLTSREGGARFWSLRDGWKSAWRPESTNDGGSARAFSPDGTVLASGGTQVVLTDVAIKRTIRSLEWGEDQGGGTDSLAFSPDGKILAVSTAGSVLLWDLAKGRLLRKLPVPIDEELVAHERDLHWSIDYDTGPVAFSPDGKSVASGTIAIRIWDVATGAELKKMEGHTRAISSIAFSPDGTVLATSSQDGTVRLWDVAAGVERRRLQGASRVYSVFFPPSGKTLVSSDGNLRIWTTAGDPLLTLTAVSRTDAGIAVSGGPVPRMEFLGPDVDKASEALSCQAGGLTFPFELCRERFVTPGLVARRVAGDMSDPDP